MDTVTQSRSNSGQLSLLQRWARTLARFISVQIVVQVVSFATGILIVRVMTAHEYALFTVANTMQGSMNQLADLGVSTALMGLGGKIWSDRYRLGQLIQSGLAFRKKLGLAGCCVAAPALYWILRSNGAPAGYAVAILCMLLAGVGFQMTNGALIVAPRLCSRIPQLQRLDMTAALVRAVLIGLLCRIFLNAAVAIGIASFAVAVQFFFLRRWAAADADPHAPPDPEDTREIMRVVRQQAPDTIYYCVQGQLTIVLVTLFGHTQTIAQIGALGRLTVLFTVVGSVMTSIVLPRFAREQQRARLLKLYALVIAGHLLLAAALIGTAIFAPGPLLWLLGKKYTGLGHALVFIAISTSINMLASVIYALNCSRAWTEGAWKSVPITIAGQILLIPFLDLSTLQGVVLLSCLPIVPGVLPFVARAYRGFRNLQETAVAEC
jgi:O-antigen/teichoic acid export membrane protein